MNTAKTIGEQMEERSFHTGGVRGSIPRAPTNPFNGLAAKKGVDLGSRELRAFGTKRIRPVECRDGVGYVPLTRGLFALVDAADIPAVAAFNWHAVRDCRTFYAATPAKRGKPAIKMHRLLMPAPSPLVVDHANGDGLDNRRGNLRVVTQSTNQRNRKSPANTASGIVGVYPKGRRWGARARIGHSRVWLGTFATKDAAAAAIQSATGDVK